MAVEGAAIHEAALHFPDEAKGIVVRLMTEADLDAAADLAQRVFNAFNNSVGQPDEWPPQHVCNVPKMLLSNAMQSPSARVFVAVKEGEVVGSNIVDWPDELAFIGPVSSAVPGAGRLLMQAVMKAAAQAGRRAVVLGQVAANARSFSLYLSLGFDPRETCCSYVGQAVGPMPPGYICQDVTEADLEACDALHLEVRQLRRGNELKACLQAPGPRRLVRDQAGAVVAYSSGPSFGCHSVAKTEAAFQALLVAMSQAVGDGEKVTVNVPHAYPALMRWLARQGLCMQRQIVVMGYGPRTDVAPEGLYFPSISY